MTPYDEAHLFVAATRILFHQKQSSPPIEDVCAMLAISDEAGHSICRKLEKLGVIEVYEDPFSIRLAVGNHLEIENISRESQPENSLASELEQFMAKKKNMDKKVEAIQAELEAKKKSMFDDLEKQLKKKMSE